MWHKKISGAYWIGKKRYTFWIDEPSEKANYLLSTLLESLQYENNVVIEIIEEIENWREVKEDKK